MAYTIIPAQPGWTCLFGDLDGEDCDVWTNEIAAWKADEDGVLLPIVVSGAQMEPIDYDGGDSGMVRIFEPGKLPNKERLLELARTVLTARAKAQAESKKR